MAGNGWGSMGWGGSISFGGGGGGGGGGDPPVVTFDIEPGTPIERTQPIGFTVTSDEALVAVVVSAFYAATGIQEVAFDADGFTAAYVDSSTRAPITGGWRFTLVRKSGWPRTPSIYVEGADGNGNPIP